MRLGGKVGGAVIYLAAGGEAIEFIKNLSPFDPGADEELLRRLFGASTRTGSVALLPATKHPWALPSKGTLWYPLDATVCESYRKRFCSDANTRTVAGFPNVKQEDGVVLVGSQVSNESTASLLGGGSRDERTYKVVGPEWSAELRWNFHTPTTASMTERKQCGETWRSQNQQIVDRKDNGRIYAPKAGVGWMQDDYLLITVLPRYSVGDQRIVVFAGTHGAGTLAATSMLDDPPIRELQELEKKIRGEAYYQALVHVSVSKNAAGEFRPKEFELVEAEPLKVEFE